MLSYDNLAKDLNDVLLDDRADLPFRFKGMYIETDHKKIILISKYIDSSLEKKCVLAEEIGHYHKTVGNIVDQTQIINTRQETVARRWAFDKLVPLDGIINAFHDGIGNRFELADYLEISEDFLESALEYYKSKFGVFINVNENYTIRFDPLRVIRFFN
ncbi:hypothetical protein J2Z69_000734 [Paenibacillus shirakamiensis]|uniref:IrrE N-terminal-like domain-containing protein n=1 Tax=Paenibacillus shirakamiensis TaxID=1265935 RepID=A0ABS4JDB0_9BACL|nr:ImmA/IrrE family metallo-endopeptidase [Paenibacillus shirakamiensis]MBP1999715.1 hypothetical protein [Paenibacillus shirakamiensis]